MFKFLFRAFLVLVTTGYLFIYQRAIVEGASVEDEYMITKVFEDRKPPKPLLTQNKRKEFEDSLTIKPTGLKILGRPDSLFGDQPSATSLKVFGVGLSRTGTTTLATYFHSLGLKVLHFDYSLLGINYNFSAQDFVGKYDDVDVVFDLPTAFYYKNLINNYPNSLFISTYRDADSWFKSFKVYLQTFNDYVFSPGKFPFAFQLLHKHVYGSEEPDEKLWIANYKKHYSDVLTHIPSPQLFQIDVSELDNYSKIQSMCAFIGIDTIETTCPIISSEMHHNSLEDVTNFFETQCSIGRMSPEPYNIFTNSKFITTAASSAFAYVTLLSNPNGNTFNEQFVLSSLVLCQSIRNSYEDSIFVDESYDIVLLIFGDFDEALLAKLYRCFDRLIPVKPFSISPSGLSDSDYYTSIRAKLWSFSLVEYKRVQFIDADQMVIRNIDHYFFRSFYSQMDSSSTTSQVNKPKMIYTQLSMHSPVCTAYMSFEPSTQAAVDIDLLFRHGNWNNATGYFNYGLINFQAWPLVESFTDKSLPWKVVNFDGKPGIDSKFPYVPLFPHPTEKKQISWTNADWNFYCSWSDQGATFYYFYLYLQNGGFINPNDQDHELIHFIGVHKPWINFVDAVPNNLKISNWNQPIAMWTAIADTFASDLNQIRRKPTKLETIIRSFHMEVSKMSSKKFLPTTNLKSNIAPSRDTSTTKSVHIFNANVESLSDPYGSSTDDFGVFLSASGGSALSSQIGDVLGAFDPQSIIDSEAIDCQDCVGVTLPSDASVTDTYQSGDGTFDPLGGVTQAVSSVAGDIWSGVTTVSNAIGSAEQVVTGPISDFAGNAVTDLTGSPAIGALAQAATQDIATNALEGAAAAFCPECAVGFEVVGAVNTYTESINNGDSPIQAAGNAAVDVVTHGFGNVVSGVLNLFGGRKMAYIAKNGTIMATVTPTGKGLYISLNTTYSLELFKLVTGGKINTTLALQQYISKIHQNVSLVQSAFQKAADRLLTHGFVDSTGRVVIPSNPILVGLATGSTTVKSSGVKRSFQSVTSAVRILNLNHVSGQYGAKFDPKEASGASGKFSMLITASGRASYQWSLDLTNFNGLHPNCNSTVIKKHGLKFGIYTGDLNVTTNMSSVGCVNCGGRYDPYLACSKTSEFSSSFCKSILKSYNCTKSTFSDGHSEYCEVGDLSGKFGVMIPAAVDSNGKIVLKFDGSISNDPNPPLPVNYMAMDHRSSGWTTLALSCPIIPAGENVAPILVSSRFSVLQNASAVTPSLPFDLVTKFRGYYNASFHPDETNGAKGTFSIQIDNEGRGTYNSVINLRKYRFPASCPKEIVYEYGLQYRVHSSWNSSAVDGNSSTAFCSHCGGSYDPFFGCSSLSYYANTECAKLGRSVKINSSYMYKCNVTNSEYCELGDISGKFGNMFGNKSTSIFEMHIPDDPSSLISADYNFRASNSWKSIVFSCPIIPTGFTTAPQLFSAELISRTVPEPPMSSLYVTASIPSSSASPLSKPVASPVEYQFPTSSPSSQSKSGSLAPSSNNVGLIIGVTFAVVIFVILVGLSAYFYNKRSKPRRIYVSDENASNLSINDAFGKM